MGREERTMETREIKWECYPHVRDHPAAHTFVERLALKGKRPKTVDAYARAAADLLAHFANRTPSCLIEADETDLDRYIASLKLRSTNRHGRGRVVEKERKILPFTVRTVPENARPPPVVPFWL